MPDTSTTPELEAAKIRSLDAATHKASLEAQLAEFELRSRQRREREVLADGDVHRILPFWAAVNDMTAKYAVDALGSWAREDGPGSKMTIVFNSPGGSVIAGLALYDFIRELRTNGHTIETVSLGMAASMGGVLLQAGDTRVMGRYAHLLIHEVSTGAIGKMSEIEDEVKFMGRLQDQLLDILSERSTLTKEQIRRRWKKTDWWLGAEEALELGFIDAIR